MDHEHEWDLCVPVVRPSQTTPATSWTEFRLAGGWGEGGTQPICVLTSENAFIERVGGDGIKILQERSTPRKKAQEVSLIRREKKGTFEGGGG